MQNEKAFEVEFFRAASKRPESVAMDRSELAKGAKFEREEESDPEKVVVAVLRRIKNDPKYYSKMQDMEDRARLEAFQ